MTAEPDIDSTWTEVFLKDLKQDKLSDARIGYIDAVPSKAPLASPTLTGTPTAPTAASGTNTTQIATTAFVHGEVSGKADKVANATSGDFASFDSSGNLADSGAKPSDFAAKADLPYALVEPGEWAFSGVPSGWTASVEEGSEAVYLIIQENGGEGYFEHQYAPGQYNDLTADLGGNPVTATRNHLLDRAGNRVVVSGDTTLTLPEANPGYLRDFLVRLEISGSTVPTITFSPNGNESVTYETDGDEFPVPDEAGSWLYSFTEDCVAHKFAVSLKKVNEVAAPQAQGGS